MERAKNIAHGLSCVPDLMLTNLIGIISVYEHIDRLNNVLYDRCLVHVSMTSYFYMLADVPASHSSNEVLSPGKSHIQWSR